MSLNDFGSSQKLYRFSVSLADSPLHLLSLFCFDKIIDMSILLYAPQVCLVECVSSMILFCFQRLLLFVYLSLLLFLIKKKKLLFSFPFPFSLVTFVSLCCASVKPNVHRWVFEFHFKFVKFSYFALISSKIRYSL